MFSYDSWTPHATPAVYATLCGRYTVERTGNERFEVYGPGGKLLDWFVTLADAKECADGQAQPNPGRNKMSRSRPHLRQEESAD